MKRYETYKECGVQWLGEIPTHWDVKRLASAFVENRTLNTNLESTDAYKFNYGTLVRKDEDVTNEDVIETYRKYTLIEPNDILINGLNLNYDFVSQRVAMSNNKGIITSAYLAITPRELVNPNYYCYFLKAMDSKKMFHGMGTGIRLTLSFAELKKQFVLFPPKAEQETIVAFLDEKTAEIDGLVSQVEREIELLKEYKQAEIAHVVTHGLNPNAPMKPSGISWIGDIPEHWTTRKMKFTFTERSEKNHPDEPVLCATQSQGVIPQSMYDNRVVVVNKGFENLKFVKVGDFVISLRSFQGGIEYAHYQGIISAAYTVLTPNKAIDPGYARLLMKSHDFIQLLKTCVTGIREGQNINYDLLKNKFIPIPPLAEQQEIVEYIDRKTTEIDRLVVELTYQVEYLKEYKQRLIADVVTGKINVQPN